MGDHVGIPGAVVLLFLLFACYIIIILKRKSKREDKGKAGLQKRWEEREKRERARGGCGVGFLFLFLQHVEFEKIKSSEVGSWHGFVFYKGAGLFIAYTYVYNNIINIRYVSYISDWWRSMLTHLFSKLIWNASKMHNYASKTAKNIKNGAEEKVFLDFLDFLALRKVILQLIDLVTRLPTTWKSGTQVQ